MFETPIVIVGNVITDPVLRRAGDQEVVRFRIASNSRRRTEEGAWEQAKTLYASVSCWGRLVQGTIGSLSKGDPVIVVGDVYTTDYEDRDGNARHSVEIRAAAVGPDLARSTARVERIRRQAESDAAERDPERDHDAGYVTDQTTADETAVGLPLTA